MIKIDNKELKDILRKYFKKTKNAKALMISIAETMNEAVAKNFEKERRLMTYKQERSKAS